MIDFIRRSSRTDALRQDGSGNTNTNTNEAPRRASGSSDNSRRTNTSRSTSALQSKLGGLSLGKSKSKVENVQTIEYASTNFGALFYALPVELQLEVISHLPIPTILNCRLVSTSLNSLISTNAFYLSQVCLQKHLPEYCSVLSPIPESSLGRQNQVFHFYSLYRAYNTSVSLATIIADWIETEIMRLKSQRARRIFLPSRRRLEAKMKPALYILTCFFFRSRLLQLKYPAPLGGGKTKAPSVPMMCTRYCPEATIMYSCTNEQLSAAHDMYRLLIATFTRQLRPPSYATTLERAVRGWNGRIPTEKELYLVLNFGGLSMVNEILSIQSYAGRCKAVEAFHKGLQVEETIKWEENWRELIFGPFGSLEGCGIGDLDSVRISPSGNLWDEALFEYSRFNECSAERKTTRQIIGDFLEYDVLLEYDAHEGPQPVRGQLHRSTQLGQSNESQEGEEGEIEDETERSGQPQV